jgi:signal transduction histidine kinase
MRRWRPSGLRGRLLLAVVVAVAAALALMTFGFNFLLRERLSADAHSLVRQRAAEGVSFLSIERGRLVSREALDNAAVDNQLWVFAGHRAVERPRASRAVAAAARGLAGAPARVIEISDPHVLLAAAPVTSRGRRLGTVVAGLSLAPYVHTERTALTASLAFAGLLLAVVCVAAALTLRAALRPVARMTADAAAWSERDLDRRFALGEPHDELTRLGRTLDGLLDRLSASLRRERRFTAELSHELRTPLTKIDTEAELALRRDRGPAEYRESLSAIHRHAQELRRMLETLLDVARQETDTPRGTADVFAAARGAGEACAGLAESRGVRVDIERPRAPVRAGVDPDVLERMLQPLIENACRYGRGTVRVSVGHAGAMAVVSVRDDGPGLAEHEVDLIFEPGARGSAAAVNGAEPGAGLGLALARRLAHAGGGEIEARPDPAGGSFTLRLPAG